MPHMTWKSSIGTAISSVVPAHGPIRMDTPFAKPAMGRASECLHFALVFLKLEPQPTCLLIRNEVVCCPRFHHSPSGLAIDAHINIHEFPSLGLCYLRLPLNSI